MRVLLLLILVAVPPAVHAQPQADMNNVEGGFADLVEKLSPAVVNISTTQKVQAPQGFMGMPGFNFEGMPNSPEFEPFRQFFEQFNNMQQTERDVQSLGSGFIMSPEGYVITNNHVVAQADEITVILQDNRQFSATLVGRDAKTDLALLKIEDKQPFPFVPLGNSDTMRVGDWVIAIGNPFGLGGSVTKGIISARQRSINAGPFDDFLQTDAPINRGNSGGPLFNMNGEVIGINTAIFSPSGGSVGIGFAIPTALAKPVIAQLKEFGRTHRGWLGVKIQEVSDEVAESQGLPNTRGALVLDVGEGSPAKKAGIRQGDIITHFNGKEISEMRFLPRMVAETSIGSSVPVKVWRQGAGKEVSVTIGESEEEEEMQQQAARSKPQAQPDAGAQAVLGMELVPLNSTIRQRLRIASGVKGLVVTGVKNGSPAAQRGARTGDVIMAVNNTAVESVQAMKEQLDAARKKGRKFVLVTVSRGKEEAFITLPSGEDKK
ncbi:MAG: DegQ family serine endoprotease [Alphaproteobacteria bacterium]